MKITIVNSSPRQSSQSGKIAQFVADRWQERQGETPHILNLAGNPLPLWDETVWDPTSAWKDLWKPIQSELREAEAFIFVVPEWGGMVPSALKNFFLLCSAQELGHKPALIVSVSSSRNGVYPVAELRMSSYKNNRVLYIPEHLIIREVDKMFNAGDPVHEQDIYLRQRLDYCLDLLQVYAESLQLVRNSGVPDHRTFPNGM